MFRVEDSRRLNGGARSSLIFPNRPWLSSQSGRDLLLYRAAFGRGFFLIFFLLVRESTSPGEHGSASHFFSIVSNLIPNPIPFFTRHSVVWLMPVSLASQ